MYENETNPLDQNKSLENNPPPKKKKYIGRIILILLNLVGLGAMGFLYYFFLTIKGPSSIALLVIGPPLYYTFLLVVLIDLIVSIVYIIKNKPHGKRLILPVIGVLIPATILGFYGYSSFQQNQTQKEYDRQISLQEASQLIKGCKVKKIIKSDTFLSTSSSSENPKSGPLVRLDFDHSNGWSEDILEWGRKTSVENFEPLKELARSNEIKEKCGATAIENTLDPPSIKYISEQKAVSSINSCQIGVIAYNMTNYDPKKDKEERDELNIKENGVKTNYILFSTDSWYDQLYITSPGFISLITNAFNQSYKKCDGMTWVDGAKSEGIPNHCYEYPKGDLCGE